MALRKLIFVNKQFYHIYNRTIDSKQVFKNKHVAKRGVTALGYYRFSNLPFKLSFFMKHSKEDKQKILKKLEKENNKYVSIISYCLMPNHFHLLVRQLKTNGISQYLSNFQNSIARYYNTKTKRKGHLFEGQFKAVRIETEEQLWHVSRYIHLNPYTSYLVNNFKDILSYKYSSIIEYIGSKQKMQKIIDPDIILSHFKSNKRYTKFVLNQAGYQRKLNKIKQLIIEKDEPSQRKNT